MPMVLLNGWKPGLRKVQLELLLHQEAGLTLAAAKEAVDRVLAGVSVHVEAPDLHTAERLIEEIRSVGAECTMVSHAE